MQIFQKKLEKPLQIQNKELPLSHQDERNQLNNKIMKTSRKKWFATLAEARKALDERLPHDHTLQIFKGVKGSRHPKEYYVGHYIEFINIY